MTICVAFLHADLTVARVYIEPSLLERRVLGAVDSAETAVAVADPAGGRRWLYDKTGQRIRSARIVAAIERQRRIDEQQRRAIARLA